MKKIMKKIFAFLLLLSLFCSTGQTLSASAAASSVSLNAQKAKYGSTWKDQQTPGWAAYQCQGFAVRMKYETGGRAVSTWKRIYTTNNLNDVQAGDIIRYTIKAGNSTALHSIFITSVSSTGAIRFADANYDNRNGIRWDQPMDSAMRQRIVQSVNNEGTNADPTYIWR